MGMMKNLQQRFWPRRVGTAVYVWPEPNLGISQITQRKVDTLPPVMRAITMVSGDLARLPACVQADTPAGYDKVPSDVAELITRAPNQYQSGFEWMRCMVRDLMTWGNACSVIRRTVGGEILELVPLLPESFQLHYEADGSVSYTHTEMGKLQPDELLHFRLAGTSNPLWGDSPVARCRATLDLMAEQEECGRQHFRTGGIGKVGLTTEENIGEEAVKRLQQGFKSSHATAGSIASPIVMQGGMEAKTIGQSLQQQEWNTARNWSVRQVAQIWGVPPQLLYADESGNVEHTYTQLRAYVDSCLSHYAALVAGEIERKLLAPGERFYFDFRHLLKGSTDQVITSLRQAIDAGIMTQNEAREMLGLPQIDGGDELIFSKNYAPGGQTDEESGGYEDAED